MLVKLEGDKQKKKKKNLSSGICFTRDFSFPSLVPRVNVGPTFYFGVPLVQRHLKLTYYLVPGTEFPVLYFLQDNSSLGLAS